MKKFIIILCLFFLSKNSFEQVLLEDRDGDQIVRFADSTGALSLIKLNTGEQALGFSYIISTRLKDPSNYLISEFSVKAKPTEGYAAVLSTGQFSPGIGISYSLTRVKNLSWAGLFISYNRDKYLLFNKAANFSNQVYSKNFDGFKASLNYNILLKSIWILNVTAGYARKNNFDDLSSVEIRDVNTIIDQTTMTEREVVKTRKVKSGTLETYNAYPMIISLTRATQTDDKNSPKAKRLRLGYNGYIKNLASSGNPPSTDAGIIVFLTRQNDHGIRNPIFGLDIKVSDVFNVQDKSQVFFNKIEIGFTTNISL